MASVAAVGFWRATIHPRDRPRDQVERWTSAAAADDEDVADAQILDTDAASSCFRRTKKRQNDEMKRV